MQQHVSNTQKCIMNLLVYHTNRGTETEYAEEKQESKVMLHFWEISFS